VEDVTMWEERDARDSFKAPSPSTAKRGRLSERMWADVRVAARVARDEGVPLRVHGVDVLPIVQKQHKKAKAHKTPQPKAEAAGGEGSEAACGEAPPRPPSKRQQRQARRLEEFHEKKRKALLAAKIAEGVPQPLAEAAVAREEQKRLDEIAAARAARASAEAAPHAPAHDNDGMEA
jgi:hypothetical protein